VKLEHVELLRVAMPLVRPFRTSFGVQTTRDVLLVHVTVDLGDGDVGEGWGECAAHAEPFYNEEFTESALMVLQRWLLPMVADVHDLTGAGVADATRNVKGYRAAKAGLEMAVLDAQLRHEGVSLAQHLGGTQSSIDVGVSVGITPTVDELVHQIDGYLSDGYRRVKLKIMPGWDVEPLTAARMTTPICLDESILSAAHAETALDMGACSIVNIKVGRVGGVLEARHVHDVCRARGVPVWCGGMLETGVGRAANVALASLPGFVFPADISASDRYWQRDLTEPFVLDGSRIAVPTGPGLGVTVDRNMLDDLGVQLSTPLGWH